MIIVVAGYACFNVLVRATSNQKNRPRSDRANSVGNARGSRRADGEFQSFEENPILEKSPSIPHRSGMWHIPVVGEAWPVGHHSPNLVRLHGGSDGNLSPHRPTRDANSLGVYTLSILKPGYEQPRHRLHQTSP